MAEEVIVEGLDYQDFVILKSILKSHTSFKVDQTAEIEQTKVLLNKIEEIIQVFEE
mgnify:FL=1|tara:strand:- start:236 stop:403 length:168 start_codon:yes stop_codon:yes gene_type:complete